MSETLTPQQMGLEGGDIQQGEKARLSETLDKKVGEVRKDPKKAVELVKDKIAEVRNLIQGSDAGKEE